MSIYHFNQTIVQRSKGQSSVAAAAYRAGGRIVCERTGMVYDFRRKLHVTHTEIVAPDHAPAWVADRDLLWNGVEQANNRRDAQVAVSLEFALPRELTLPQWLDLTRSFIGPYVSRGQVADVAIHTPAGNPHAHVMLTMNRLEPDGFGQKVREWNPDFSSRKGKYIADTISLMDTRRRWADCANDALKQAGLSMLATLSAESHVTQNIDTQPTIHRGRTRYLSGDTPLDRDTASDMVEAQRELQRIAKQEQNIHRMILRFEDELAAAREALAQMSETTAPLLPIQTDIQPDRVARTDADATVFAATPGPLLRIAGANELPRTGNASSRIVLYDEFHPQ